MQMQSMTQHFFPFYLFVQYHSKQHLEVKGGRKETSKKAAEGMVGSVPTHITKHRTQAIRIQARLGTCVALEVCYQDQVKSQ